MPMKDKKRDIIYMFIASLAFSAVMAAAFIIFEQKSKLYLAIIPQLVLAMLIGVMYMQEKAVNKAAEKLRNKPESEIRQQLLENGNDILHSIETETMADDLKRIFRRKICPLCFGIGFVLLPLMFFLIYDFAGTSFKPGPGGIFAIGLCGFLGFGSLLLGIYHIFGLSVNSFIKKEHERIDDLERSYMMGNMVCGNYSGVNIGIDYCVHYDVGGVYCFRIEDIESVKASKQITMKRDRSGFSVKEKKEIFAEIRLKNKDKPYKVDLTELQLEYVCDEFTRHGVKVVKNN